MGYYLGLDVGSASVGWAVSDENYKLNKVFRSVVESPSQSRAKGST